MASGRQSDEWRVRDAARGSRVAGVATVLRAAARAEVQVVPFNNYTRFFEAAIQRSRFVLGRSSPVSNQCYTCLLDVPNRFFQRARTQQPSAFKYLQTSISTLVSGSRG